MSLKADVVIVGGGMSGLEVARGLLSRGLDVLLLEAGDFGPGKHLSEWAPASEGLDIWLDAPRKDPYFRRRWMGSSPPHYVGHSGLREVLGGRSLYWNGVILPIERWAFDEWPTAITTELYGDLNGGLSLYDHTTMRLLAWAGRRSDGSNNASENLVMHLASWGISGFRGAPVAARSTGDFSAYSPLFELAQGGSLKSYSNFRVLCNSRVVGVTRRRGADATRLFAQVARKRVVVESAIVVLAGGSIENARLTAEIRSGGSESVQEFPIVDHIVQGFVVWLPADRFSDVLRDSALAVCAGELLGILRSNVFVSVLPSHGGWLLDVWAMGEQRIAPENQILIRKSAGSTSVSIRAGISEQDRPIVLSQQEGLSQLWIHLAHALRLRPGKLTVGTFGKTTRYSETVEILNDPDRAKRHLPMWYYCPLGTIDHEAASLPFGHALDSEGCLDGDPQIRLVGPCTFPRAGAANPSLTTLALASRLARSI